MRWERFDLEFPADFPVLSLDSLHARLSDRDADATKTAEWQEWALGLNGLVYRFLACDEHGANAIASLRATASPPQPERKRQELALFGFFYDGLSCLECVYYALYFVGCLSDPRYFDITINRRRIQPRYVRERYASRFAAEPLTEALSTVEMSTEFAEWAEIRNFLSHRGVPGRAHYEGGARHGTVDWNMPIENVDVSQLLEPDALQQRRDWLGRAVTQIIVAAAAFALQHVP
jgi:hypothetical protein